MRRISILAAVPLLAAAALAAPSTATAAAPAPQSAAAAPPATQPAAGAEILPAVPLRYEIWVELDPAAKALRGREEITWTNTSNEPVPDMLLHLYWNAFKNDRSTFMRENDAQPGIARGRHPGKGEWGWIDVTSARLADGADLIPAMEFAHPDEPLNPDDQTVLRLRFPAPVEPGAEVRVNLEFAAKVPRTVARSGYYRDSFFVGQWFPKPGVYEPGRGWNAHEYHMSSEFFADYADFRVHITTPSRFTVGASGREVEVREDAARGVVTRTFAQARIHDFAWTADPAYIKMERTFSGAAEVTEKEYAETAAKLGLPVEEVRLPDVKMTLLIAPDHKSQADRHFKALRAAIKYYGLWYGPYPYETVTMIDPPFRTGSGGMEYPTLFTAGTSVLPTAGVLSPEGVIVHEFGHGYWYGIVGSNEFEEAWLDEGINTYSTGRVQAKAYGKGMLPLEFKGLPLGAILPLPRYYDYETDRAAALQVVEFDPVATRSWEFHDRMSYGANVYMRASTVLNTLERLLGEETMMRVMRTYYARWKFRHPTSADFFAVAKEVSGRDLGWFFDQLLRDTLQFDYGVERLDSTEVRPPLGVFDEGGRKVERDGKTASEAASSTAASTPKAKAATPKAYVTTLTLRRYGEAKLDGGVELPYRVVFEDGSAVEGRWDGRARWARFSWTRPSRARSAQVDPAGVWLIDADLANNSRTTAPARGGPARVAAKLFILLQNVLLTLGGLG